MAHEMGHAPVDLSIGAALIAAAVAKQTETRLLGLEIDSSAIDWGCVSSDVARQGSEFSWTPAQCQRLWRWAAYGQPVGDFESATGDPLPDSDGEDDAATPSPADAALLLLHRIQQGFTPHRDEFAQTLYAAVSKVAGPTAQARLEAAVIAIIGPPPPAGARSAFDLFVAHYAADLEGGSAELRPIWEACDVSLRESFKAQEVWDTIATAECLKRYNELASQTRRLLVESLPGLAAVAEAASSTAGLAAAVSASPSASLPAELPSAAAACQFEASASLF